MDLSLWDTNKNAYDELQATFAEEGRVFNREWSPDDMEIERADFIFIDPPDKRQWPSIREVLRRLKPRQCALVWLPIGADTTRKPPGEEWESVPFGGPMEDALSDVSLFIASILRLKLPSGKYWTKSFVSRDIWRESRKSGGAIPITIFDDLFRAAQAQGADAFGLRATKLPTTR